jgi:hypothetical protein
MSGACLWRSLGFEKVTANSMQSQIGMRQESTSDNGEALISV